MGLAHATALAAALAIGAVQLISAKGTLWHRTLGYLWVYLAVGLALAGFVGGAPPERVVSLAIFVFIPSALILAQLGAVRAHAAAMISVFVLLAVAGTVAVLAVATR